MTVLLRLLPILLALTLPALAEESAVRYPADLAWRLVTEREIQEITECPESLGNEVRVAEPLFEAPVAPLGELEPVADSDPFLLRPATQWDMPSFPTLDPPLPGGLPEEIRVQLEEERQRTAGRGVPAFAGLGAASQGAPSFGEVPTDPDRLPEAFGEISTRTREAPSAMLRPRAQYLGEQLVLPEERLPEPFSLRRYHTAHLGFFQVAVYGGTSGFGAERAYRTLRAAAPNRRKVEGIGEDAFMALLPRAEEPPKPAPSPAAAEEGPAFAALEVMGPRRPDLLDEGLIKARSAPAFQAIPVDLKIPEAPKRPEPVAAPVRTEPAPEPEPEPEPEPAADLEKGDPFAGRPSSDRGVQVLVAFFPSKAVVLEIAMDDRIGDSQSLMRLAFMVQSRLLQRW